MTEYIPAQKAFVCSFKEKVHKISNEDLEGNLWPFLEFRISDMLNQIQKRIDEIQIGQTNNGLIKKLLNPKNRSPLKKIFVHVQSIFTAIQDGDMKVSQEDKNVLLQCPAEDLVTGRKAGLSINTIGKAFDMGQETSKEELRILLMELMSIQSITVDVSLRDKAKEKLDSFHTTEDYMALICYQVKDVQYDLKEQKKAELRVAVENLINRGVDCRDILLSVFDLLEDVYLFPRTYQINMCGHEFILHHGKIYAEIAREYNQEESLSRLVEMAVMKYRINESIQINTWQFVAVVSEIHSDQRLKDAIDVYLEQYDKDNGRFLDGQHCTLW